MNHFDFLRVAAVVPRVNVADCEANATAIIEQCGRLAGRAVRLAVFPELSITSYTVGDLLHSRTLLDSAYAELHRIAAETASMPIVAVVGVPINMNSTVVNCAAVISSGRIHAVVGKTYLPNYNEFYENRWFTPAESNSTIFVVDGVRFAVEICEDLWAPIAPSTHLALAGAEVILNLSASDDIVGKRATLENLIKAQSARCCAAYVYSSCGYGESTTDVVFDGKAIIAENGAMVVSSERWHTDAFAEVADIDTFALRRDRLHHPNFHFCAERENSGREFNYIDVTPATQPVPAHELLRGVNPHPFVPADDSRRQRRCEEIINIQTFGLMRRLDFTKCTSLVVGISGGLDSTLALMVACRAFDRLGMPRTGITAVTMPGLGTSDRTLVNARDLMDELGVTSREISIVPAVERHFADIGHDPSVHDLTYENSQARERTQILMDIANQTGGMVLGTGDLSELALGWSTYNGDHMSMYGVNADVPKTLVKSLVEYLAEIAASDRERRTLLDIVDTPISPELTPADVKGDIAQKTEDLVGPYELHDFFLFHFMRTGASPDRILFLALQAFGENYTREQIIHWMRVFFRRFFSQQFKRSCMPDGPKVGSVSLSPRGDWRMPSDAAASIWLKRIDELAQAK
ncbi:MAG: NAD(+) synthase [Muribaculaceae bacterium]|nr:NAD(+) synthase [Muribaculaceae bacterium]